MLVIRYFAINLDHPEVFEPDDPVDFGCGVELGVGPHDVEAGLDLFYAQLCTPKWYARHQLVERAYQGYQGIYPGRGRLFTPRYDGAAFRRFLHDYVAWCNQGRPYGRYTALDRAYERLTRLFVHEAEDMDEDGFFEIHPPDSTVGAE